MVNHTAVRTLRVVLLGLVIPAFPVLFLGCKFPPLPVRIDFNSLTYPEVFDVGQTFTIIGAEDWGSVDVKVLPFQQTGGAVYPGGYVVVDNQLRAGGSGLDLNLNNVCLGVRFGPTLERLELKFGEYGGNINFQTNDHFVNQEDFYGLTLPGISVSVTDLGGQKGSLAAAGDMTESPFALDPGAGTFDFVIGGQELWIDHLYLEWTW
ncbi:MAG: hypothetical protein JW820_11140 [Spirochaetales bacterium]|nr:hypothetical protein [Spirochaetales bacterium]